ncbi:hypothetical protein CMO92_02390 [Candidatus Woesearchaeota archaeon]|nr:hypothetical protein [Candidatus Woesearchaeota archaeon]|tara:strand:- start:2021 stop:2713 length:693 start_codon:yes stop_codon:yes gene_type:complete
MRFRLGIVAKNSDEKKKLLRDINKFDLKLDKNPSLVISLGGDGTFLIAERRYPGVPKILIRDSEICTKCSSEGLSKMIDALEQKNFVIKRYKKILVEFKRKQLFSTNDCVIRNTYPYMAARFQLFLNGKELDPVIGDGIVASGVFGSTGYYHSITRSSFKRDWRIAYNNPTIKKMPLSLKSDDRVELKVVRGPMSLTSDNDQKVYLLENRDRVRLSLSKKEAQVLEISDF